MELICLLSDFQASKSQSGRLLEPQDIKHIVWVDLATVRFHWHFDKIDHNFLYCHLTWQLAPVEQFVNVLFYS